MMAHREAHETPPFPVAAWDGHRYLASASDIGEVVRRPKSRVEHMCRLPLCMRAGQINDTVSGGNMSMACFDADAESSAGADAGSDARGATGDDDQLMRIPRASLAY